jgi:hypothetical protein
MRCFIEYTILGGRRKIKMKISKIITLIITFLMVFVLALELCSCSKKTKLPHTSDNFSQEFMDSFMLEYRLYDSNLYYTSRNAFEVELRNIKIYDPEILGNARIVEQLHIASIKNVSEEEFVAVEHIGGFVPMPGGGTQYAYYVYQRNDAPVPMKDYTISSVSIIGSIKRPETINTEKFSGGEGDLILAEYSSDDMIINSLKDSYDNAILDDTETYNICWPSNNILCATYFYLLFEFEEVENLVWFVPIVEDTSNNLYYLYSYYDKIKEKDREGNEYWSYQELRYLAPISGEIVETIRELEKNDIRQE